MDAIKKKMQAMKVEKDNAMDRADACEQAAKDAKIRYTTRTPRSGTQQGRQDQVHNKDAKIRYTTRTPRSGTQGRHDQVHKDAKIRYTVDQLPAVKLGQLTM
jgi:hypothetical protein